MARKMKDSGIEWIGEIPEGWELTKVKRIFDIGRGRVISQQELTSVGYPVYSSQTKNNGCLGYISTYDFDKSQLTWTTDGVNAGTVFLREGKYNCTNVCGTLAPKNDTNDLRYLKYALEYIAFYHKRADINGFKIMNNEMAEIELLLPPLFEQQNIANYLDFKCSQTQSILEQSLFSIEEYKKLKQAIITQAVTKGVRGKREMKDSGVEWIGEIPVDWEISRIKYVSIFEPSCDFRKLTPETNITYSPMECIKNGTFERRTSLYGNLAHTLTPFQNGDIVMAKVTPCFENGNIAIMNELQSGYGLGSSELFVFRPQNINTRYLFYWLQNKLFVHQACATMTGTGGLKRISPSFVKNCNIHYPSTAEQAQIAAYLDTKCAEIDGLIAKKEQLVKELEGYKKSLIYEVVTGKREV